MGAAHNQSYVNEHIDRLSVFPAPQGLEHCIANMYLVPMVSWRGCFSGGGLGQCGSHFSLTIFDHLLWPPRRPCRLAHPSLRVRQALPDHVVQCIATNAQQLCGVSSANARLLPVLCLDL